MQGDMPDEFTPNPARPGDQLRAAREAQGLDLAEVAARTRIPQRHLEAIEQGTYSGLPSITYATGFAKAYARAVGADEVAIARQVRDELGQQERPAPMPEYPLEDPTRVASSGLAWFGVIVAVLLVAAIGIWYGTNLFRGGASAGDGLAQELAPTPAPTAAVAAAPTPQPSVPAVEHVTLVARGPAWIRVTDANGTRLVEKELAAGERYEVPDDAARPRVRTGRPDQIQVLINGAEVAPLGTTVETVEAEISSAALRARGQAPAAAASAAPAVSGAGAAPGSQRRLGPRVSDSVDYSSAPATPPAGEASPPSDTTNP